MTGALDRLHAGPRTHVYSISVGLEPDPRRLPECFGAGDTALVDAMRAIVSATADLAGAFKPNLAFFEALGPGGWAMLERVRALIPDDRVAIADAKRGDIGSSSERYAAAIYTELGFDAATVNPLMGRDAVEPFLAHPGTLTFVLCLTSNPSADDLLVRGETFHRIAELAHEWDTESSPGRVGLVVGATRPEPLASIRRLAPSLPVLVPGVGAQGGSLEGTIGAAGEGGPVIIHATRSLLPSPDESTSISAFESGVRSRALALAASIAEAVQGGANVG
ncbi:MAG: orotidine-5'-phosphate decarboxylase [Planctomycetota bacterium]